MRAILILSFVLLAVNASPKINLLGAKECTWGPSYWCSNITTAAGCNAVKHCIQTVWEHKQLEPDTDSVCQTCLKMVKEARDQLESNETQEEIKEVFEGSCKLIPIKIVNQECIKLADEFIPELIDTLASQMNPQVVCSIAGLCNNERIDRLIEQQDMEVATSSPKPKMTTCQGCYTVVEILEKKFDEMSRDQVLQSLLQICGHMSSLSDSCSNIIVTYFSEIYNHLQNYFNPNEVCLMAGECSAQFHTHANVEITPLSDLGYIHVEEKDDLPCELCEQLVNHLRDLLVANTTEKEFEKVLLGLCKQTKSFKSECTSIVDEYYPVIYNFLLKELNASYVCGMVGICPSSKTISDAPFAPLLNEEAATKAIEILASSKQNSPLTDGSAVTVMQKPELMQLPIERIFPPHLSMMYNKQTCLFCEYFLHYLQEAVTNPKTEEKIKDAIDKACSILPNTINETCVEFVNTYGEAVVAIFAQEIDPSTICPLIKVCPAAEAKNVEIFMQAEKGDHPKCPLCLFALTKLEELIKDHKTKDNIKNALNSLCSHLSGQVKDECDDFVNTYSDELVDMLVADFTPQEVCVYLKLCVDHAPGVTLPPLRTTPEPETANEIGDYTINGKHLNTPIIEGNKPQCVLCEFIMSKLDEELEDKNTEDEIKAAVHNICNHLPKSVSPECNKFVDQYADMVIMMLDQALKPAEICAVMKLCDPPKTFVPPVPKNVKSPQCVLCKILMRKLETLLPLNVSKDEIEKTIRTLCTYVPTSMNKQCEEFMDKYEDIIVDFLIETTAPAEVCSLLMLCKENLRVIKSDIRKCAICETAVDAMSKILGNPKVDHSIEHVLEKACRALPTKNRKMCKEIVEKYGNDLFKFISYNSDGNLVCRNVGLCGVTSRVRVQRDVLLGSNKCTWGPGYWCANMGNAEECGDGAKQHCQKHVWKGDAPK